MPDWEAEGLLEGLDPAARDDRVRLLDALHDEGFKLEALSRAVAEDRLSLLRLERQLLGDAKYSLRELAERTGLGMEWQRDYRRAIGLAVPGDDEIAFSDADLEEAERGQAFTGAGMPDDQLLEIERVLGQGIARYAEAFRLTFATAYLHPGDSESDVADRYSAAAAALRPLAGPHFAHLFFLHLRELVRSDVISAEERRTGELRGREETAIGFADLVGFTALGETVGHEELGGVAGRLTEVAAATIAQPVRLVKTIGDAVMFVGPEPAPLIETALALVEAAAEAGLPPLRAGVAYGPAVNRWGDWYGSTVNLASRLTTRARPSSVLASEAARDAAKDAFGWSPAGEKRLKGFSAPQRAFRARPLPSG
jgi:adenylate cyclase